MAGALIDTLLQTVAAPRPVEPSRGAESRGSEFRPVLDEALTAGPKPSGRADAPPANDDGSDSSDLVANNASVAESVDNDADEGGCVDCSRSRHNDQESTEAADEAGVAEESDEASTDEADDESDDAIDISSAAAEAAAAVEAAQPTITTTTSPEDRADAVGDVPAVASSSNQESTDDDASAKRTAAADVIAAQPAGAEIGDVQTAPAQPWDDLPPEAATLEAAGQEAERKDASPADKSPAKAKGAAQVTSKAGLSTLEDAAVSSERSEGEEIAATEAVTNENSAAHETVSQDLEGGDPEEGRPQPSTRDGNVTAVSQPGAASQVDVAEAVPTSNAPAAPAPATPAVDATNSVPHIAAVAVPTSQASDGSAASRGATAIARLSAERSLHPSGGQGDDVDAARFVGRVEGAVRAAHQREGRVQVRLSPPELGALRIELTLQNGVMSARLEAETPAARNLLLDNLPALRERLAQQDVRIDQFDVDVRRDNGGSAGGNAGQNGPGDRPAHESNWRQNQQRQDRGGPALAAKPAASAQRDAAASDAALDVRV